MKAPKKVAAAKPRPVVISCLAAKLLGHTRTANASLTSHNFSNAFPAFNTQELTNALGELLDKDLLKQKGHYDDPTYTLTDYGREGRVAIA
jgi:hypothetical protein